MRLNWSGYGVQSKNKQEGEDTNIAEANNSGFTISSSSNPGLTGLPPEVVTMIFELLPREELPNLRFINREVNHKTWDLFCRDHVRTVYVNYTEKGLERFSEMAKCLDFSKHIRRVVFRYFHHIFRREEDREEALEMLDTAMEQWRGYAIPYVRRHDPQYFSDGTHDVESRIHDEVMQQWSDWCTLESEQRFMNHKLVDLDYLTEAFESLAKTPGSISIILDEWLYEPDADIWLGSRGNDDAFSPEFDRFQSMLSCTFASMRRPCRTPLLLSTTGVVSAIVQSVTRTKVEIDILVVTTAEDSRALCRQEERLRSMDLLFRYAYLPNGGR